MIGYTPGDLRPQVETSTASLHHLLDRVGFTPSRQSPVKSQADPIRGSIHLTDKRRLPGKSRPEPTQEKVILAGKYRPRPDLPLRPRLPCRCCWKLLPVLGLDKIPLLEPL